MKLVKSLWFMIQFLITVSLIWAGSFAKSLGDVKEANVSQSEFVDLPYITWGGDMVTFFANGGLQTKPGSLFDQQGLKFNLIPGDDFQGQVRNYLSGRSPYIRGTFRMLGMASEAISKSAATKGVVVLQMTWSAGDHMVSRKTIRNINDLKGQKIVLQAGGPHVGMLDDILKTAQLKWSDVEIVWAKDLTGTADSPAEIFRTNPDVAACFVITPDMIGLCGGLRDTGSGAEGTVKGSRVLVSTADLSRSIADMYMVRKDYYDAHRDKVTKFVAAYMKASEEVNSLRRQYEEGGSEPYIQLLRLTQKIYGKEVIPTLEADAHGLLSDCRLVGYPGNLSFFRDPTNLTGFEAMQKASLDLATEQKYASIRTGFHRNDLDYDSEVFKSLLTTKSFDKVARFDQKKISAEIEDLTFDGELDDRTIISFTISFEPNQSSFSAETYGAEYKRVISMARKYGNAVVAIRGHSDPTKTLIDLVQAGLKRGILRRTGSAGNYKYSFKGKPLDFNATQELQNHIINGNFDGVEGYNPRATMQAALNLSRKRAEAVKHSIIEYASINKFSLDSSQIQPVGVGIREPFIAKPSNLSEAKQNMRVEFRLLRVDAEVVNKSEFDF